MSSAVQPHPAPAPVRIATTRRVQQETDTGCKKTTSDDEKDADADADDATNDEAGARPHGHSSSPSSPTDTVLPSTTATTIEAAGGRANKSWAVGGQEGMDAAAADVGVMGSRTTTTRYFVRLFHQVL
ncbi:hypothetical protein OC835_001444, partial [Tilletia horrida]